MLPCSEMEEEQKAASPDTAVEVDFRGPFSGRLILAVSGGILPGIVANMLGEDEAASAGSQSDALGELANVICGNVLPLVAGDRLTFDLASPRLFDSATLPALGRPTTEVHVGIEEGRADVYLFLQSALSKKEMGKAA